MLPIHKNGESRNKKATKFYYKVEIKNIRKINRKPASFQPTHTHTHTTLFQESQMFIALKAAEYC